MATDKSIEIMEYRRQGLGYKRIAAITGYSLNTVKSVCRRNQASAEKRCLQCGAAVEQTPHRKEKVCAHCGQPFESYGNQNRKYCSRRCYDDSRRKEVG